MAVFFFFRLASPFPWLPLLLTAFNRSLCLAWAESLVSFSPLLSDTMESAFGNQRPTDKRRKRRKEGNEPGGKGLCNTRWALSKDGGQKRESNSEDFCWRTWRCIFSRESRGLARYSRLGCQNLHLETYFLQFVPVCLGQIPPSQTRTTTKATTVEIF